MGRRNSSNRHDARVRTPRSRETAIDGGCLMKSVVLTMSIVALAAPAGAQQAMDHSAHMQEMQAQAAQPPAGQPSTGQPPAGQPPAGAPGAAGGRGGPQIDVPW